MKGFYCWCVFGQNYLVVFAMADKKRQACLFSHACLPYQIPMHDVTPKVVAMAVSTVMTIWRIFPQMVLLLFSIMLWFYDF